MVSNSKRIIQLFVSLALFLSVLAPEASVSAQDENVLRVQREVEIATLNPNIATDGTSMELSTPLNCVKMKFGLMEQR